VITTTLSTLNISKAKDENGQEIPLEVAIDYGSLWSVRIRGIGKCIVADSLSGSPSPTRHVLSSSFWIVFGDHSSKPKPFKCTITPRSDKAHSMVIQATTFRTATP
jgi:hypothetical protein